MNRLFGTSQQQPVEATPQQAPPQQQAQPQLSTGAPTLDLYGQTQKVNCFHFRFESIIRVFFISKLILIDG